MSVYVVDASVATKWFITEPHAAAALSLLEGNNELHVPDFFLLELDNVVCKWIRRGVITNVEGDETRSALGRIPFHTHSSAGLRDPAYAIANETGCTFYDCLYVALAILLGAQMVTADQRLYNALPNGPFAEHVLWVEDVPR